MLFCNDFIKNILDKTNIVFIISSYTTLNKKGKYYIGLCPLHKEKSPSLYVDSTQNNYYCYGCGEGGNAIDFVMRINKCSFEEAVSILAKKAGISMPESKNGEQALNKQRDIVYEINKEAARFYYHQLRSERGLPGGKYCKQRLLSDKTTIMFGLGYASKFGSSLYNYLKKKGFEDSDIMVSGLVSYGEFYNGSNEKKLGYYDKFWDRLMFPIMNEDNKVIGFGGRVLGNGKPKYLNSPETIIFDKGKNLYGLNFAKHTTYPFFIVCEGNIDVISMHQAGFNNAVASLGTALTEDQVELISKYTKNVIIAYDNDAAGIKAAARAYEKFSNAGVFTRLLNLAPCKDPDEFLKTYGKEEFAKRLQDAEDGMRALIKTFKTDYSGTEYYEKVADALIKSHRIR